MLPQQKQNQRDQVDTGTAMACPDVPGQNESRRQWKSRQSRKLEGDRLARKRELDRQAQRSAREKTKNLIAHLESRIESLIEFNSSGNVKELIDQLEQQRKENEDLRTTLRTIGKLAQQEGTTNASLPNNSSSNDNSSSNSNNNININETTAAAAAATENDSKIDRKPETCKIGLENDIPGPPEQINDVKYHNLSIIPQAQNANPRSKPLNHASNPSSRELNLHPCGAPIFQSTVAQYTKPTPHFPPDIVFANQQAPQIPLQMPSPLPPQTNCGCCKSIVYMNNMLERGWQTKSLVPSNQRARDADIPIRAILHGWDAVTSIYPLDPIWTILRAVDETAWSVYCGATERLAVLWLVSLLLRYRTDRSESNLMTIPLFMQERPSQRHIPHTPLFDFIVWPTLRERLVFSPHKYCTERFYSAFWDCFRFTWPLSFQDAYAQQGQTGLYQPSDVFIKHFYNLHFWRMTPKFLVEFPELRADVPVTPMPSLEQAVCQLNNHNEAFGMESGEFGRESMPQAGTFTPGFLTEYPPTGWSTDQNMFL